MDIINLQTVVDVNDIATFRTTAQLSTPSFGISGTATLDDLKRSMMYHLGDSVWRNIKVVDSNGGLSESLLCKDRYCLKNKFLYNYSDGTISYLKALRSMDKSLEKSDNEEIELVLALLNKAQHDGHMSYVSLGCGDGQKDYSIIKNATDLFLNYYPIDINGNLIKIAFRKVSDIPGVSFGGYLGDFTALPSNLMSNCISIPESYPRVFMCLGHTIGNYRETVILKSLYNVMRDEDYAIISFERQVNNSEERYHSSENEDFLLNPFKSIDAYSYVRSRYLTRSQITGLSDIHSDVKSFLFTLGSPEGESLPPIHIIWTNRYEKEQIDAFFKNHPLFKLIACEAEERNIVVLLKKKESDEFKIDQAKAMLNKWLSESELESIATKVLNAINNEHNVNRMDVVASVLALKGISKAKVKSGLESIKISTRRQKKSSK